MRQNIPDEIRYSSIKPLSMYCNSAYPNKYYLHYNNFEPPKEFDEYLTRRAQWIEPKDYNIVFGIKSKPEEFTKYDFLHGMDGPDFIVHRRVKEVFDKLCPNDFQAFKVRIKNFDPKDEPFVNEDYYLINILNLLDIFDWENTTVLDLGDGLRLPKKKVFKENCMQGHMLARDKESKGYIFFAPELAKHFPKVSKGAQFLMDYECP